MSHADLAFFREDRKQKSFPEANLKSPKNVMQCVSFNVNFCAKEASVVERLGQKAGKAATDLEVHLFTITSFTTEA